MEYALKSATFPDYEKNAEKIHTLSFWNTITYTNDKAN